MFYINLLSEYSRLLCLSLVSTLSVKAGPSPSEDLPLNRDDHCEVSSTVFQTAEMIIN